MKNLKYFPFERNKYYYGKLLTERDFMDEQQYFNDKRRLINRFLGGAGVAAGLNVVEIDEKSVSVEAGVALDFSGRELVVDTPVIRRLSTIDGFDAVMEQGKRQYAYLCIEYDEKEASPAHNAVSSRRDGGEDFDKYKEGYRLYLTQQEPEGEKLGGQELLVRRVVLYEDGHFCVTQTLPRFIQSGASFETEISLENLGYGARVSCRLSQSLECVLCQGEKRLEANWDELLMERGQRVSKTFKLKARDLKEAEAVFHLGQGQLSLKAGQEEFFSPGELSVRVPMGREDEMDALVKGYYRDAMERAVTECCPQGIYLARIYLVRTDKSYMIDRVEENPFGQYVYSGPLLRSMIGLLEKEGRGQKKPSAGGEKEGASSGGLGVLKDRREETACGTVEIDLGIGGKRGQRYFSHEIFHGLGLGNAWIDLSLIAGNKSLSGSGEIFEDVEPRLETAACLDASKGSFVIGLRLLESTSIQRVTVAWRVRLAPGGGDGEAGKRRLFIKPSSLELKVRESAWLEAVCENAHGMTVAWAVQSRDGGTITGDGLYTAPNTPGVYEVRAWCQEAPETGSSVFIIVRE